MKKLISIIVALSMLTLVVAGCSQTEGSSSSSSSSSSSKSESSGESESSSGESSVAESNFDSASEIAVISREDGSGTRGAFTELFGVAQKNADGETVDYTTEEASIVNSTSVVMTTVAGNPYAIGYISLGSMNDTVKALKIDGAEATVDNINSGDYKIARPFNIATKGEVSEVAQDFINYIMSADGQQVIEDNGYIKVSDAPAYTAAGVTGTVVVAGSSSVTPVMEKLKEAYLALNPDVTVEIQQSDSTTGMTSTLDGICDIGMASRELKDTELEGGLTGTTIAMDGIAVIVNLENPLAELTADQVRAIFMGESLVWSDVVAE